MNIDGTTGKEVKYLNIYKKKTASELLYEYDLYKVLNLYTEVMHVVYILHFNI